MTASELGAALAEVRLMRKMSLREVADKAGISTAYLHKLERGQVAAPSPHVLYALAQVLKTPYSKLMQLAGYVVPNDSGADAKAGLLAHALSSEELTDEEAAALASYLAWYRHDQANR
jgi:transcriptional regulator with XRE-family HTH domain